MLEVVKFSHQVQVAHRLFDQPGKCQQIHGHCMTIEIGIEGEVNERGVLVTPIGDIEFGAAKKIIREYLDTNFDHKLLLNSRDPWCRPLIALPEESGDAEVRWTAADFQMLPGLVPFYNDPTTENIARLIAQWASAVFETNVSITLHETDTNSFSVVWEYEGSVEVVIGSDGAATPEIGIGGGIEANQN